MLNLKDELIIHTKCQGMYEITNTINNWITKNTINKGQLNLFIQHTSASLKIMENASSDVLEDINSFFKKTSSESLLSDKLRIDLKICSYSTPLFSKGFLRFLTFVRKYFKFLLDGSLIKFPKIFLEIRKNQVQKKKALLLLKK